MRFAISFFKSRYKGKGKGRWQESLSRTVATTALPCAIAFIGTLVQHFGKDVIFKDIDSIPLGVNFIEYVRSYVARSAVVLVVIGRSWLDIHDARGHRRIDDPNDFVRLEIEEALTAISELSRSGWIMRRCREPINCLNRFKG